MLLTIFFMLIGQPLHAFDLDKIGGNKITVGNSPKGTKFTTLDGVERTLNGEEIMIKMEIRNHFVLLGFLVGWTAEYPEQTQSIFLESAYFNPVAVRKGAKFHGLNTRCFFPF